MTQHNLVADLVCLGLPGRIVLTRLFHLPDADGEKMATSRLSSRPSGKRPPI